MIPLRYFILLAGLMVLSSLTACAKTPAETKLRALIIDGQNNHDVWPKSTMMMKSYLEQTGMFEVDVQRSRFTWRAGKWIEKYPLLSQPPTRDLPEPQADPEFAPVFTDYDVVISNFGWKAAPLPSATRQALENYMAAGGGLVVVHAADNSWPEWQAYNEMIGLGGWGGRNEESGPYVYYNDAGERIVDSSPGRGGSHGPAREFQLTTRDHTHPIMQGIPPVWLHTRDECYDRLRGPAKHLNILATAYADADLKGSGRHEPMLMTLTYGKGRIFHSTLGHDDLSFESVGFITTFQRGTEWAATGAVTLPVPPDFPTANTASSRPFNGP